MKHITIAGLLSLMLFVSCNKNIDRLPLDSPFKDIFYSSQAEITQAVNACYRYIGARSTDFPGIPTPFLMDAVTDIMGSRLSVANYDYKIFKNGTLNSSHNLPRLLYTGYYEGINRANALLENMNKAEAVSTPAVFKRIKSEARVIRAILYIDLIQTFGDVPLVTKIITIEESQQLTRTPKAQILSFIYQEIDESVADLANRYTGADKGRITKGAAYAMKARVALYNSNWAIAKAAAKACMDLNVYKLYPSYKELFLLRAINNDEIILDDQYMAVSKTNSYHQYNAPRNSAGQAQSFPNEDIVAGFECTDGKLVSESPLYDPTNPFANRDPRLAGAVILPRVWDGVTIKTPGGVFNGIEHLSSKEKLYKAGSTTELLPTCLFEKERTVLDQKTGSTITNQEVTNDFSSFTGYLVNKYIDSVFISLPTGQYTNFILCRYPEVLLTYAEASIELGTIDQTVLDAINMARARAYGNTSSLGVTNINATNYPRITTTNPTELRKIVRRERKIELCFEGFRYEDLKRWGMLVKALSQRKNYGRPENYSMLSLSDKPVFDTDELVTFPYATQRYGLNNEQVKLRFHETYGIIPSTYNLFPIPITEIQINPAITQNPGF